MLVLLFALRRWLPRLPGPLIAMLLAAGVVVAFDLDGSGVAVVGEIPRGIPTPALPDFSGIPLGLLVPAAVGVAIVGYSDNVLTGAGVRGQAARVDRQRAGVPGPGRRQHGRAACSTASRSAAAGAGRSSVMRWAAGASSTHW